MRHRQSSAQISLRLRRLGGGLRSWLAVRGTPTAAHRPPGLHSLRSRHLGGAASAPGTLAPPPLPPRSLVGRPPPRPRPIHPLGARPLRERNPEGRSHCAPLLRRLRRQASFRPHCCGIEDAPGGAAPSVKAGHCAFLRASMGHRKCDEGVYALENRFRLNSPFAPSGDQPEAIRTLVAGLSQGMPRQVLLGVTGSGKTYTMANVIAETNRPALVIAPTKTLAAQLFAEFKELFPDNAA